MPRNLTPLHLRCAVAASCPSITKMDNGEYLIVGKSATMAAALDRIPVGEGEHAVIVGGELLAGVVPGWKTIDSAPRDGTMILAYLAPIYGERPCGIDLMLPLYWREGYWWDDIDRGFSDAVTHWMPLPLPPAEKVEA